MTTQTAAKKKTAARKEAEKSVFERLGDSVIGQPFAIANKAFLASLGLFSTIQTEFGIKFDEFAKDGEVVRDKYQESFTEFRKNFFGQTPVARKPKPESAEPKAAA
jgi:hypothetical protein